MNSSVDPNAVATQTLPRIFGLIPVGRLGGDPDHTRSAFGRYAAEAAIWTPAALLPGPAVIWDALGGSEAQSPVSYGGRSEQN